MDSQKEFSLRQAVLLGNPGTIHLRTQQENIKSRFSIILILLNSCLTNGHARRNCKKPDWQ